MARMIGKGRKRKLLGRRRRNAAGSEAPCEMDALRSGRPELLQAIGKRLRQIVRKLPVQQSQRLRSVGGFFAARAGKLQVRRIEHAQNLLLTTDLPIARIAVRLGFGDSQHFNKQFRRLAGCNPTAYRLRGHRLR